MKVIKSIFLMIAITMALTLFVITRNIDDDNDDSHLQRDARPSQPVPIHEKPVLEGRVSRFLQQIGRGNGNGNGRSADHCKKDQDICSYTIDGRNTTCCNNKCVDLVEDANHCGSCKNKCLVTMSCCRGQCVDLAYDKRHCGACNHRCMPGGYCIYGMCDYA